MNIQLSIFQVGVIMCNVPFFTPNFYTSFVTILSPCFFVNVSYLQPMIFSLFSINEHTLHFTTFLNPSLAKPFAHGMQIVLRCQAQLELTLMMCFSDRSTFWRVQ